MIAPPLRLERSATPPLYTLLDWTALTKAGVDLRDAAREMIAAGVRWIQVRAKAVPSEGVVDLVRAVQLEIGTAEARLWVNDRADVARLVGAGGVHVGQEDLPPWAVRRVVGESLLIGRSTHTREQVDDAARDSDVDLVAVGPIRETRSKRGVWPEVGLGLVRYARSQTQKPIVAIGGIDVDNAAEVRRAGADTVAVIGAAMGSSPAEIGDKCRELLAATKVSEAKEGSER